MSIKSKQKVQSKREGKDTEENIKKKPLGRLRMLKYLVRGSMSKAAIYGSSSSTFTMSTLSHLQELDPQSSNINKPLFSELEAIITRAQTTRSCKPATHIKHKALKIGNNIQTKLKKQKLSK